MYQVLCLLGFLVGAGMVGLAGAIAYSTPASATTWGWFLFTGLLACFVAMAAAQYGNVK